MIKKWLKKKKIYIYIYKQEKIIIIDNLRWIIVV